MALDQSWLEFYPVYFSDASYHFMIPNTCRDYPMIHDRGNVICCNNVNEGFRGVANSGCFSNNLL